MSPFPKHPEEMNRLRDTSPILPFRDCGREEGWQVQDDIDHPHPRL